jgi:hypothetical protein
MAKLVSVVTAALLLAALLRSADAAAPNDAAAVRATLEAFSAALAASDVGALRRCTTATFHLIEDGIDYDREKTEQSLREAARRAEYRAASPTFVSSSVVRQRGHQSRSQGRSKAAAKSPLSTE